MEIGNQEIVEKNGKKYINDPLSEAVIGACINVFGQIGAGHRENFYEKCLEAKLKSMGLHYEIEQRIPIMLDGQRIGFRQPDFIIEKRLVVELKIGCMFSLEEFRQVKEYLKLKNLKLAIIILFTTTGVRFRRVVNLE